VEDPCSIGTVLILCLLRLECSSFRCLASVLVYSDARRSCAVGTGVCLNKHAFQDGGGSDQVISTACDYFQFSLLIFDSACRKSMILIIIKVVGLRNRCADDDVFHTKPSNYYKLIASTPMRT